MKSRPFWYSFCITLFLLITSLGFIKADYEGRRLSFGDSTPPLQMTELETGEARLEMKLFGMESSWDATRLDQILDFLCDFCCIPHN